MSKQYLVINGDQILVDAQLVFSAIRQANGDWQQVEQDIFSILENFQGMVQMAEENEKSSK